MFTMHATTMVFLVRDADGGRVRQLPRAAADRRPRRRLPAHRTRSASGASCSAASSSTRRGSSAAPPTAAGSCTSRTPTVPFSPSHGIDFWALGLQITGIASLTGAINLIVTVLNMRAPGMNLMKMPIFTWMIAGRAVPAGVRHPGHHRGAVPADVPARVRRHVLRRRRRRRPAAVAAPVLDLRAPGGVHPRSCPASASSREVLPVFSRKPLFGYKFVVFSGAAIGFIGWGVWAHHMFASRPRAGLGRRVLGRDDGDRHPDRREDRQLDDDDVGRQAPVHHGDAVRDRPDRRVHDRRPVGRHPRGRAVRHAADRHLLHRRPLPLRAVRRRASSASSPASTTGGRRSSARCSARSSARPTSG